MVTEAEARRIRPMMSGIVALAVALVAAIGWYYAGKPNDDQVQLPTAEWKVLVKAGRQDGKLAMVSPAELPKGWRATNAEYLPGVDPRWRLALNTDRGRFVGILEARNPVDDLMADSTDGEPAGGPEVRIDGVAWRSWTAGDDYFLVRTLTGPKGVEENVVVGGSAPETVIKNFVASLRTS